MSGETNDGLTDYSKDANALTHADDTEETQTVEARKTADQPRRAHARGTLILRPATVDAIREDDIGNGDVLATARVGAVQAVKHTWETIPRCHQRPITSVETEFETNQSAITMTVAVETAARAGCEMEALQGVTTGLNTIWDMVKAAEKDDDGQYPIARLEDVQVVDKGAAGED